MISERLFLRGFTVSSDLQRHGYPWNIPVISRLQKLTFHSPVTFFIGENGTGKSTLLEALALACGFNAEGGSRNFNFSTFDSCSDFYQSIRLLRSGRAPTDGYFFRAESFYNLATDIENLGVGHNYGNCPLHGQSHGESFLSLITNRFWGNGLYLLDEPEAALSPSRQMTLLAEIGELVKSGSQLIIATHSPILMAYPESEIFCFDSGSIQPLLYEDTSLYQITKHFINNYRAFTEKLLADKDE